MAALSGSREKDAVQKPSAIVCSVLGFESGSGRIGQHFVEWSVEKDAVDRC